MKSVNKNIHVPLFDNMEKHNTLCDATAPSLLSLLEDAPVLKTEVNEQPSTCQSLHSAINQESHQDTNTSNLQQPTAPSSPNQTCNYSCLNISRPSTGSIPRQGSINSGHFNPTAASLHKTRGVSLVIVLCISCLLLNT